MFEGHEGGHSETHEAQQLLVRHLHRQDNNKQVTSCKPHARKSRVSRSNLSHEACLISRASLLSPCLEQAYQAYQEKAREDGRVETLSPCLEQGYHTLFYVLNQ
jgi:hypothetical protein